MSRDVFKYYTIMLNYKNKSRSLLINLNDLNHRDSKRDDNLRSHSDISRTRRNQGFIFM